MGEQNRTFDEDVKSIAEGPKGIVRFALGSPAPAQWSELSELERQKLIARFMGILTADGPLPDTHIRPIRNSDGILEIKLRNPPLRALCFKEYREYRITHIIRKPKERRLSAEAAKSEEARRAHNSLFSKALQHTNDKQNLLPR